MAARTTATSELERLAQKYNVSTSTRPTTTVEKAFDLNSGYEQAKGHMQRISQSPYSRSETGIGDLHKEMAAIQYALAELAEEYGQLNVDFKNTLGTDRLYDIGETVGIAFHDLLRHKQAAQGIKLGAIKRRGDAIEILVNKMAEVLEQEYEKAVEGKARAATMQLETVAHMKTLDRKLIESLRGGLISDQDIAGAEIEANKLESELQDVERVLGKYETEVKRARSKGNLADVTRLTTEMHKVLDIKYGILDGQLSAEGVLSEIRRKLLDSSEGVQSAKGALSASRVNYHALTALIDAMSELEIKYRHAKSDMIPVFKMQGKIAMSIEQGLTMKDALARTAEVSQRLMEANSKLVLYLAEETFQLITTPIYDISRAREAEQRITQYMGELNRMKIEWAQSVRSVSEPTTAPHYAKPK